MPQRQTQKVTRRSREETEELPQSESTSAGADLCMDELLEEIDNVLEENAEEFVKGYVQRGGE